MVRFLRFFALFFILCFSGNVFGAGYTCPAVKKYTSCAKDFYMTKDGAYNGTPTTGNVCTPCPSGYTCAGGTANKVAATRTCSAGTYWNGSACANCGGNAYYCPGFSNVSNPSSGYGRNSVSSGYYSTGGDANTRTGQAKCGGNAYYCSGGVRNSVSSGYYSTGGDSTTRTGQSQCTAGNYCSGGVSQKCAAGTYAGAGATSCAACTGRTKYSAAGASSCSTVTSGYYTTGCNTSNNNCTGQTACGGNAYYCSGGIRNSVTAGYYSTGGDSNTRTGQSQCSGTVYCTGGVKYNCPNPTTSKRTTFPAHYYNPEFSSAEALNTTGSTSISGCRALTWYLTGERVGLVEYTNYNATTNQYDDTTWWRYMSVKPGYYLTNKNHCGGYAYYVEVKECPAGSYCPGKDRVSCNTSNQATVHTTNFGMETCPSGYPNSATMATAITACYSNNKSRPWSGTQTACALPENCATKTCNTCSGAACTYVAFANSTGNGDGAIKSGCATNNAACQQSVATVTATSGHYISGTTCPLCPAGYQDGAGATSESGCVANVPAGYFVDVAKSSTFEPCSIGTAGGEHRVNYGFNSSCDVCSGALEYQDETAQATCKTVETGYYKNNNASQAQCPVYYRTGDGAPTQADCVGTFTKEGLKIEPEIPENCYSVGSGNCTTAKDCTYTMNYAGTILQDCTPTHCTLPITSVGAKAGYYVDGFTCLPCSDLADGLYPYSTLNNKSGPSICKTAPLNGEYIASAGANTATKCAAGTFAQGVEVSYGSTSTCDICAGDTYSNTGATECTACLAGYTITGNAVSDHDAASDCKINCAGGTYLATENASICSNVGIGYWAAASTVSQGDVGVRNMCPVGMTTIGYGASADESGDCGRVLHIGDNKIYLRSDKKTEKSLAVGVNGDVYYGNMSTDGPGALQITSDGITYTVYDDSML